jgi:hypothetical protein
MKTACTAFVNNLKSHTAFDATEAAHQASVSQFVVANSDAFWQRETLQGHVTGSAFVVNAARTHTLLLHDEDASPAHGALREAIEETGILSLRLASESLFDIDVHAIPARNKDGSNEPAHFHYDARYLVMADDDAVQISTESLGFRWVLLRELAEGANESGLVRMAKKMLLTQ